MSGLVAFLAAERPLIVTMGGIICLFLAVRPDRVHGLV
jgi:hypothetical protein